MKYKIRTRFVYITSHEIVPVVKKDSVIRVLILLKVNYDKKAYQSSFSDESGMQELGLRSMMTFTVPR